MRSNVLRAFGDARQTFFFLRMQSETLDKRSYRHNARNLRLRTFPRAAIATVNSAS